MIKSVEEIMREVMKQLEQGNQNGFGEFHATMEIHEIEDTGAFWNGISLEVLHESGNIPKEEQAFCITFDKHRNGSVDSRYFRTEELKLPVVREIITELLSDKEFVAWIVA